MKALRLLLLAALAAAFLSPLAPSRPAEAQVSIYDPSVRTADQLIQRRALAKIGRALVTPANGAWWWEDFNGTTSGATGVPTNWRVVLVGTGATSYALTDEAGGVIQMASGATAASSVNEFTDSPMVRATGTGVWYMAHRSKITTAVTAATVAYVGLFNAGSTRTLTSGFFGGLNATNFVVQYDGNESGSSVNLGVAVDTAYHIFEEWGVGDGKLHCSIDLSSTDVCAGLTMASPATDSHSVIRTVKNGADAVNRAIRTDWIAILAKRS